MYLYAIMAKYAGCKTKQSETHENIKNNLLPDGSWN